MTNHDRVPAITVITDGGWSKRSHKSSYKAKSGVAIIIGQKTGKILFLGVWIKFCTLGVQNNKCYKNWDSSSFADIILEVLNRLSRHGTCDLLVTVIVLSILHY